MPHAMKGNQFAKGQPQKYHRMITKILNVDDSEFPMEERAEVVMRAIGRPKLLPLRDAESEVLEFAFPFAETSLQQDATFPCSSPSHWERWLKKAGKEGHCALPGV